MFNIKTSDGRTMLGMDVDHATAAHWLRVYRERYPAGKAYPNGNGSYPDFGFRIVEVKHA